jgi:2',3'-cyclic-nucleotide 2'-phosphodiesterase (5'-nucleotidase family)
LILARLQLFPFKRVMRSYRLIVSCVVMLPFALAFSAAARQVPVTILCTTDVHGHVLPCLDSPSGTKGGGMLRCASAIEEIRRKEPNVLYVDCGDLIQGAAESWLTQGRIMTRTLEWLRCDAWVVGNHDFDWGIDALAALHDQTTLNMLCGNLVVRPDLTNRLYKVRAFVIKNLDGVRVAIVGLTTPGIPTWTRPDMLGNVSFTRSVAALSEIMPSVRAERPDMLILLVHQGYKELGDDNANEVNQLARSFPEFDVILGGHLHRPLASSRLNGVLFSQAGYYGNWLGRVDLVFDTVRKKVVSKTADVIPVEDRYEANPELESLLRADLDKADSYLNENLGVAETGLVASAKMPAQSPIQQLICKSIVQAVKADIALHGILVEGSIEPGVIRRSDIWRIIPYENRIGVAELTLLEIREILEENTELIGSEQFLGVYGLSYELYPNAALGERVRNLCLADGSKPHARKRFRVAMNSYALASGGGRFPVLREIAERPESRLEMTDIDTRTAVVEYVRKHNPLRVDAGAGVTVVRREDPKR